MEFEESLVRVRLIREVWRLHGNPWCAWTRWIPCIDNRSQRWWRYTNLRMKYQYHRNEYHSQLRWILSHWCYRPWYRYMSCPGSVRQGWFGYQDHCVCGLPWSPGTQSWISSAQQGARLAVNLAGTTIAEKMRPTSAYMRNHSISTGYIYEPLEPKTKEITWWEDNKLRVLDCSLQESLVLGESKINCQLLKR